MKTLKSVLAIVLLMLISVSCNKNKSIELFNGENLDNWKIIVPDDVAPESVFWVSDNVINVKGIPNGYIRTLEEYENYKLHVEWRWVAEPKNSGVLLHISGEDMVWPNCIESQLQAGNAGDIVLIGKGAGITVGDSIIFVESETNRFHVIHKFGDSSEKAPGEWNTYDIDVDGNKIGLKVNGVLQNSGTNATKSKGKIGIQSEGGPMQFRNIYLVEN